MEVVLEPLAVDVEDLFFLLRRGRGAVKAVPVAVPDNPLELEPTLGKTILYFLVYAY